MDEYESLNHTRWECKYHGMRCSAYRGVCGVREYAEQWADVPQMRPVGPGLHRIIRAAST